MSTEAACKLKDAVRKVTPMSDKIPQHTFVDATWTRQQVQDAVKSEIAAFSEDADIASFTSCPRCPLCQSKLMVTLADIHSRRNDRLNPY